MMMTKTFWYYNSDDCDSDDDDEEGELRHLWVKARWRPLLCSAHFYITVTSTQSCELPRLGWPTPFWNTTLYNILRHHIENDLPATDTLHHNHFASSATQCCRNWTAGLVKIASPQTWHHPHQVRLLSGGVEVCKECHDQTTTYFIL